MTKNKTGTGGRNAEDVDPTVEIGCGEEVVAIEEEEETALERAELGGPGGDGRKDVEFVVAESVNCPDADVADYEQGANRKTISAQALLAAAGFVRNGKEDVEEG